MSLDPILKQLLEQIPALPSGPIDHPAVRAQADGLVPLIVGPAGLAAVGSVQDATAPGLEGPVPVRIYRPVGAAQGTLHYIHGGGRSVPNSIPGTRFVIDPASEIRAFLPVRPPGRRRRTTRRAGPSATPPPPPATNTRAARRRCRPLRPRPRSRSWPSRPSPACERFGRSSSSACGGGW